MGGGDDDDGVCRMREASVSLDGLSSQSLGRRVTRILSTGLTFSLLPRVGRASTSLFVALAAVASLLSSFQQQTSQREIRIKKAKREKGHNQESSESE